MLECFFIVVGLASLANFKLAKLKWWQVLGWVMLGAGIAVVSLYFREMQVANYVL